MAAVIRERMSRDDWQDLAVRAAAVRAVATVRDDDTLDWLLSRVLQSGGLLRRTRLAPATPEMLAALTAIATRWPDDLRTAQALSLARSSASQSVRAATERDSSQAAV